MGALEAPQDKYGQEHRTGTSRVEQTDRDHGGAGSSGGHGGAGSSGGHGGVRGPHRVPQRTPPFQRQGGRQLEWPPWPQQEEPPAPDESPRTRQGYLKCSCGHNKTDTRHSWP